MTEYDVINNDTGLVANGRIPMGVAFALVHDLNRETQKTKGRSIYSARIHTVSVNASRTGISDHHSYKQQELTDPYYKRTTVKAIELPVVSVVSGKATVTDIEKLCATK